MVDVPCCGLETIMNEPARKLSVSYSDYLAQEQASETKHENALGAAG